MQDVNPEPRTSRLRRNEVLADFNREGLQPQTSINTRMVVRSESSGRLQSDSRASKARAFNSARGFLYQTVEEMTVLRYPRTGMIVGHLVSFVSIWRCLRVVDTGYTAFGGVVGCFEYYISIWTGLTCPRAEWRRRRL
jgi:hypothetical protein